MKNKAVYFCFILLCLVVPASLTLGNALLVTYTQATYQKLLFQNQEITLSRADRKNLADSLYQGITRQKSVQLVLESGQPAFSQKEITHMLDVASLVKFFSLLFILLITLSITFLLWLHKYRFPNLTYLPAVSFFLSVITLFLVLFKFEAAFTLFHLISFSNDFWLLDPSRDLLINLFPSSFFVIQFAKINIMTLLELILLFFGLRVIKK
jgi:integral membrane protein (TIGR01906 family)